jgi:hypothetical protein
VLGPDDVERPIRERKVERIALSVRDEVRERSALGQHGCDAAVLVGEIDAGDAASEFVRDAA